MDGEEEEPHWDGNVPRDDVDQGTTGESNSNRFSTKVRVIGALAVLLLVAVLIALLNEAIKTHESTHLSYAGITKIDIRVEAGTVTLFASTGNSVEIDRKVDYSLRGPAISEKVDDTTLIIREKCSGLHFGDCSAAYTLSVPTDIETSVRTGSGAISADGLRGKLNIQTSGGKVNVAKTNGDITFTTDNGPFVGSSLSSLQLHGESKSGKITAMFEVAPSTVDVKSTDGDILVQLPKTNAAYRVDASSSNSKSTVDVKLDSNSPRTITAKSENGKVTVER